MQGNNEILLKGFNMIMSSVSGYIHSRMFQLLIKYSICDLVEDGPKTIKQLSNKTGLSDDSVNRLMRYFVANEMFTEDKENIGTFSKTETSSLLTDGTDLKSTADRFSCDYYYKMFESLPETFETDQTKGPQSIGLNHFFDIFEHDQKFKKQFNMGMKIFTKQTISSINENMGILNFSSFNTIVDIGGSHGLLIGGILENKECSNVNGINFDLQVVLDDTDNLYQHQRLKHVSGDFFKSVPRSDCYILKHIFHDWDRDLCVKILKTIGSSIKENGKVYIFDTIIDPLKGYTKQQVFMDIIMKQLLDARERTTTEWDELFDLSGFKLERTINEIKSGCMVISKK